MAETILILAAIIGGFGFVLALARFVMASRAVDRVVAFDGLTVISVSAIVLAALLGARAIYLDVALVYALLSFLGVIVAGRYLEGGE